MDERPAVVQRDGLEHDVVVAGAQRPLVCDQRDLQVVRGLGGDPPGKNHPVGFIQWLIVFFADADVEDFSGAGHRGAAVFCIEVQHQDVTPVARTVQRGSCRGKRVIDQCVNIAFDASWCFAGVQMERLLELVIA